jgi:phosphoribosylformimino-5-aminoimidazole carboxamide ribotide isomerase
VILLPAIDILDGRAVRLVQGRFEDRTVYADDPLAAARDWVQDGARWLHVVDLDGARKGAPVNLDHLRRIAAEAGVAVQFGGGLRSIEAIDAALAAGAARVVIGTAAFRDPALLDAALAVHAERIVVGVDVRGGRVAAAGWTQTIGEPPEEAIARLRDQGVATIVYTNVDRDGMLEGPDLAEVRRVASLSDLDLIWSGGIARVEDLAALAQASTTSPTLAGVIVGKALYERRFTVADGVAALEG